MTYKILNKNGKCVRKTGKDGCFGCPGFKECDEEFKELMQFIDDIRGQGLGYYSWEGNYHGPYVKGKKVQRRIENVLE